MAAAVVLVLVLLYGCGMGGAGIGTGVMASSDVYFVGRHEATLLRNRVHGMFRHAYDSYMVHAFPLDELKPMTCSGHDTLGGYSLTLVDALDMLAVVGNRSEFVKSVRWLGKHLSFNKNKTVSLFETNIRVLGGLLSAHLLASDDATGMHVPGYANELLLLAEDLGRRLLPAFDTPTGIPFGSINLRHGVSATESQVTATAGGGTLLLEFGVLSRLTGDPVYEEVARTALVALWERRSALGLVGAHISVMDGEWTHRDAGIGTSIDSFYEYLIKGHVLFGDADLLEMFFDAYNAVLKHLFQDPWYVEVNMDVGMIVWPLFNSLQAFWPGLQVLVGDVERAVRTHRAFASVWRRYGFTPEGFNLQHGQVQPGQQSYPLRPELAESTYWLYKATRDPSYLELGREMVESLELARCPCGFCHIKDVERHTLANHMESFFLSETVKYLYLLFDLAATNGDNIVDNGPYEYVFTTEGHILPLTPEISLPPTEHCAYLGAYCGTPKSNSCRATNIPLPPEKPPTMPQQAAVAAAGSPLSAILEAFATASKAALKQVGSSLGVLRPGDTAAAAAAAASAVAAAAAAAAGGGGEVRVEVAEVLPISLSIDGQSVTVSEAGVKVVQLGGASASATGAGAQNSASVAVDSNESTSGGLLEDTGTTSDRSSSSESSSSSSSSSSSGGSGGSGGDGGSDSSGEATNSRQGDTSSGESSEGGTGKESQHQERIQQQQQQQHNHHQHKHQHQDQQQQLQQQELQSEGVQQDLLKGGEVESPRLKQNAPVTATPATAVAAAAAAAAEGEEEAASDDDVSSEDSRREVMPAPSHGGEAAAEAQAQEGGTGAPAAVQAEAIDAAAASGAAAASDAAAAAEPSAATREEVRSSNKAPAQKETRSVCPAPTKHMEDDEDEDDDDDDDDDDEDDDDDDEDENEEKQKKRESQQLGEESMPAVAAAPPHGGNPLFTEPQVRCEGITFWRSLGVSP